MPLIDPARNFVEVTVSTGYDASATTIVLSSGQGALLPDPAVYGQYNTTWWNSSDQGNPSADANKEIVRILAISTDTLTVLRAQEGTTASTKNTAGKTYKMVMMPSQKFRDDIEKQFRENVIPPALVFAKF